MLTSTLTFKQLHSLIIGGKLLEKQNILHPPDYKKLTNTIDKEEMLIKGV